MPSPTKRPSLLLNVLLLLAAITLGAHLSGIPLVLTKVFCATVLFMLYGYCSVRIVSALQIESTKLRGILGLMLGALTLYLTWAVRIPAFSGWDVGLSFDPSVIYAALIDRAGSMEISKGFGHGTSAEGPSWLMLGTYLMEAVFFVGVMALGALAAGPETEAVAAAAEVPRPEAA